MVPVWKRVLSRAITAAIRTAESPSSTGGPTCPFPATTRGTNRMKPSTRSRPVPCWPTGRSSFGPVRIGCLTRGPGSCATEAPTLLVSPFLRSQPSWCPSGPGPARLHGPSRRAKGVLHYLTSRLETPPQSNGAPARPDPADAPGT